MKFSSVIVALFAAASVYSKTTFKSKNDLVRHLKETSPDCAAELSKYETCILTPTSTKDCSTVKGDSCSKFYSNPDKYVGHCIGNKKISLFTQDSLSNLKSEYKEVCKKLENKDKKTTSVVKKTTTLTKKSKTSATSAATSAAASATASASAAPTAAQATSASKPEATSAATSAAASNAPAATNAPANDANAQTTDAAAQDTNAQAANGAAQDANAQATNAQTANGAAQDPNAPLSAPVAGANGAANTGNSTITNVVAGNTTAQNPNGNLANVDESSDATKLTVSLLVTIALVMFSF